jgi:hypothetical protein
LLNADNLHRIGIIKMYLLFFAQITALYNSDNLYVVGNDQAYRSLTSGFAKKRNEDTVMYVYSKTKN